MHCDNFSTPKYLKWKDRRIFSHDDFCFFHKLYRIKKSGNPICIPESWATAISCNWSKLVDKKDALHQPEVYLGDDYDFVFIEELRQYRRTLMVDGISDFDKNGLHELSCVFFHSPTPCNYSHTEILIRHRIFDKNTNEIKFNEIYTHKAWEDETAYLKKSKAKYCKVLKKRFRLDMIILISRSSNTNNIYTDLKAFLNTIKWKEIDYSSL